MYFRCICVSEKRSTCHYSNNCPLCLSQIQFACMDLSFNTQRVLSGHSDHVMVRGATSLARVLLVTIIGICRVDLSDFQFIEAKVCYKRLTERVNRLTFPVIFDPPRFHQQLQSHCVHQHYFYFSAPSLLLHIWSVTPGQQWSQTVVFTKTFYIQPDLRLCDRRHHFCPTLNCYLSVCFIYQLSCDLSINASFFIFNKRNRQFKSLL